MHHKKAMSHMKKAMDHMMKHHEHMEPKGKKHHKKENITKHDRMMDKKNIMKARKHHKEM